MTDPEILAALETVKAAIKERLSLAQGERRDNLHTVLTRLDVAGRVLLAPSADVALS